MMAAAEPSHVSDAELDAVWSAVMTGASASASASGSAAAAAAAAAPDASRKRDISDHLGVRAGESSFSVPGLHDAKRGRVLPEDGTYTEDGADPTEGGRYGPQWREETLTRQHVLESNTDYQFIVIVAGRANAPVERMYDDDSVGRVFRMRLAEAQTRLRVSEVQQSRDELQESLTREQAAQNDAFMLQGRITDRRRTDLVLLRLPAHIDAVKNYIEAQSANVQRLPVGAALELGSTGLVSVPIKEVEILDRATVQLLGGTDSVNDDPDIGTTVQISAAALIHFAFGNASTGDYSITEVQYARNVREAMTIGFRAAYPEKIPKFYGGAEDIRDARASPTAPVAFRNAVQRLLTLNTLDVANVAVDRRDALLAAFVTTYGSNPAGAVVTLIDITTRELRPQAHTTTRAAALPAWLAELRTLVAVLRTAHDLHDAESVMHAPRRLPARGGLDAPFTVAEIASAEGVNARERAILAGATAAGADAAAQVRIREVLANPPNHIFSVPMVARDVSQQFVAAVEQKLYAIDGAAGATVFQTLQTLGILGSPGLAPDLALLQSVDAPDRGAFLAGIPVPAWTQAMVWYEQLGGSLFADRDAWVLDPEDQAAGIASGVEFPASSLQREQLRGNNEIPVWGPDSSPPPRISSQMRSLWEQYVPILKVARAKITRAAGRTSVLEHGGGSAASAAATGQIPQELRADAPVPQLTVNEGLVYRSMTGGFDPTNSEKATADFQKTQWPLFVFMGRLLETDMVYTNNVLQRGIDSRAALLDAIRGRVESIMRGVPQTRPVVEPPYQHRRGWVEEPANSGVVALKPIVVSAIEEAWGQIRRMAPHIARGVDNNIETMQHHPDLRGDFAELVAVNMSLFSQRFPTRYVQLGQRAHTRVDQINALNRFIHNTTLTATGPSLRSGYGVPTAADAVQVNIRPVSAPVRGGHGFFIL